ncbi:MAG: VOC family protein [Proteobacteria bacterium]|nr:VOC family protein [Pseudomonadota bacterium]
MPQSAAPFLMFEGKAEEALSFYASAIPGARIDTIERYGPDGPKPGTVKMATLDIAGLKVMATDSPVPHGFTFTPSMSLFLTCASEVELRDLATKLANGGNFLMPIGSYGFSQLFAWLADRYGVSWQLNLP